MATYTILTTVLGSLEEIDWPIVGDRLIISSTSPWYVTSTDGANNIVAELSGTSQSFDLNTVTWSYYN